MIAALRGSSSKYMPALVNLYLHFTREFLQTGHVYRTAQPIVQTGDTGNISEQTPCLIARLICLAGMLRQIGCVE